MYIQLVNRIGMSDVVEEGRAKAVVRGGVWESGKRIRRPIQGLVGARGQGLGLERVEMK